MSVHYLDTIPAISDYYPLFLTTGWNGKYGLTMAEVGQAIARSWYAVSAYDGERLVGSGRVISDGIHHALIVDMIVDPARQGQGIGGAILKKILGHCRAHQIRDVQLFAAKGKAGFYERHGFAARPADAPGMQLSL